MEPKKPVLCDQTLNIYEEALALAKVYCPDLDLHDKGKDYFDPDDPALVILKLFSETTEFLLTQTNRIPNKYQLAFLDFIGLKLLPPKPAKVYLTFYHSEGAPGAYVPARTCVASSEDSSVVFETSKDLSVVDTGLEAVFSINPLEDKYTEHQEALSGKEEGFIIFGGDSSEKKLDHILYLGDEILLDVRRKTKVDICLMGENLSEEYFNCWVDGKNNPLKIIQIPSDTPTQITVSLFIPMQDKVSINEASSFWIAVKPKKGLEDVKKLPKISTIKASFSVSEIIPDMVLFNDIPMEPKKGFYPFGEEPKIEDTFYIGSEEAFSKENAKICFHTKTVDKKEPKSPILKWEYWSGSSWKHLKISESKPAVESFEKSGTITFECPLIPIAEINGLSNRWIRVTLESGDYGTAGDIEEKDKEKIAKELVEALDIPGLCVKKMEKAFDDKKIAFGFEYRKPDFNPPFIEEIKISYKYENKEINKKIVYNNFKFKNITENEPFIPYEITDDKMPALTLPALYLGFKKNLQDVPLTFFFAVKKQPSNEAKEYSSELRWEFFDENNIWSAFMVEDETKYFRTEGIISFVLPSNIKQIYKFGKCLYWIRAKVLDPMTTKATGSKETKTKGSEEIYPKLRGIFPNTVLASNNETILNEVLGSGNGEPGLSLSFSKKPVLEGQIVDIREPAIPSTDGLKSIEAEGGKNALRIEKEAGEVKEVWVAWNETRDFALSDSLSRHYILDRVNGKITFGDGIYGMKPPRGKNNIVARKYQSGGGKKGDVAAGILTSLKTTIPYIESVTNKVQSSGGEEQENLESAIKRGPSTLKNGGRAVTIEDFEWLSYEASQYVAKAKCFAEKNEDNMNLIKVRIVPISEEDTPYPETGFMKLIEEYLKERALITLSDKISVQGPREYVKVNVTIYFKPVFSNQSKIVADRIVARVKQFLHPLKGGQDGKGWDFGQYIFTSEVATLVEGLEGVDYVTKICLQKGDENPRSKMNHLKIDPESLPSAGLVSVNPGRSECDNSPA